jgi:ketosteroid isomerase-like protein
MRPINRLLQPIAIALVFAVASCGPRTAAAPAPGSGDEALRLHDELTSMLAHGAAAWNRGDLDAFMSDYLPDERTSFVTNEGVLHGVDEVRSRYAPRFAPGGVRDSLSFEKVETDWLAPGVAYMNAVYVLSRGDSVVARGPTSLVLVRREGRWLIVHDHSS